MLKASYTFLIRVLVVILASQSYAALANVTSKCQAPKSESGSELNRQQPLRLLNWNIHKHRHPEAKQQLKAFGAQVDVILLQEATLHEDFIAAVGDQHNWHFSPGYHTGELQTGVLTASRAVALEHCSQSSIEPWLKTPKAAGITRFAIMNSEQDLLIINLHGVNFEWGIKHYGKQLNELDAIIDKHQGPLIFAGDLNTWNESRQQLVDELAAKHQLIALQFADDQRRRFMGRALDHIYVRGLHSNTATTPITQSSDHNPMLVELQWTK